MSEEETRSLVERFLQAFNASDHDGMLALISEDVAIDVPAQQREIGREKLRWRLAGAARHFRAQATDIATMTAPGGLRAAAEFTIRGAYLATVQGLPEAQGQTFQMPAGIFVDIDDDGLISRIRACYDPQALSDQLMARGQS